MMPNHNLHPDQLISLLAALPHLVILLDRDRRIQFINRVEEGYDADEVMDRDALEFVDPRFQDAQAELVDRVFDTGESVEFEIPIADADGDRQWHEGRLFPLRRDGEGVESVVVVTRNVTARRRAVKEAERLRSLLPICSWCGRVRTDRGFWKELEAYVQEVRDVRLTHGICSECEDTMIEGEAEETA